MDEIEYTALGNSESIFIPYSGGTSLRFIDVNDFGGSAWLGHRWGINDEPVYRCEYCGRKHDQYQEICNGCGAPV